MLCRALVAFVLLIPLAVLADDTVPRPQGAGTGKLFGEVGLVHGTASLQSGISFPAQPGMPVLEGDAISVDTGSYLLLVLRNGQVVRIDEELTLSTSDIIAAQVKEKVDLDAQLQRLLGKAERKAVHDRIAGAYARVTAATEAPVDRAAPLSPAPSATASGGVSAGKREAKAERQKDLAKATRATVQNGPSVSSKDEAPPAAQPPPAAPLPPREAPDARGASVAAIPAWGLRDAGGLHPQSGPEPLLVTRLRRDKAFLACVEEALRPLPALPESIEVLIRVKGGRVERIVLGGGLAPPACLGKHARRTLAGVKTGWVSFTLHPR